MKKKTKINYSQNDVESEALILSDFDVARDVARKSVNILMFPWKRQVISSQTSVCIKPGSPIEAFLGKHLFR